MASDCIFCKIGSGEVASEIIYRDSHCFAIRDIAPKAPVHFLVIPNEHLTHLSGLTPGHGTMVGAMLLAAEEVAVREGIGQSGYRLIINQRGDAGQMVDHLHMHVLGGHRLGGMA